MAGGKVSPRQKMINMMYLVLTAMLALNISAKVLNAFDLLDKGIGTSNKAIDEKNKGVYAAFDEKLKTQKAKTKKFYDLAMVAKSTSDSLNVYIDSLKEEIIRESGGRKPDGSLVGKKNKDVTTRILVGEQNRLGKAFHLHKKVNQTREKLLALIDKVDPSGAERKNKEGTLTLQIPDSVMTYGKKAWAFKTFNQLPVIAAKGILTKYQNDAKTSEGEVIDFLISQIGKTSFKFDKLSAAVIAPSSFVMQGEPYKADIFLAASSSESSKNIKVSVNGSRVRVDPKTGIATFTGSTSSPGVKKCNARVSIYNPDTKETKSYTKSFEYTVSTPSATVSATKMNVLYIGVDNPMEISYAGVPASSTKASMSSGRLTPSGGGKYIARVTSPGTTQVSVSAPGQKTISKKFRVKRIPDPVPALNEKRTSGKISKGELLSYNRVSAKLKDFDFDAKFKVKSYELIFSSKGEIRRARATGGAITGQMKSMIKSARPKDIVIFSEIRAVGPAGDTRKIPDLTFNIK